MYNSQETQDFFERPANGIREVYSHVWIVVSKGLRTLAILGLFRAVALLPGNYAWGVVVSKQPALAGGIGNGDNATNLLAEQELDISAFDCLSLAAATLSNLVLVSLFDVALVRAAGEVYVGQSPTWKACLVCACGKMRSFVAIRLMMPLLFVGLLIIGGTTALIAVWLLSLPQELAVALICLSFGIFIIWFVCMTTLADCAVMLENKDGVDAVRRCWILCKSRLGLSAMSLIPVQGFVLLLNWMVVAAGFGALGNALSIVLSPLTGPLPAMFRAVVYMSLCIQKERPTAKEFLRGMAPAGQINKQEILSLDGQGNETKSETWIP